MRTTIEIDDAVFREMRAAAQRRGVSLKQVVNEALRKELASGNRAGKRATYRCPTFHLGRPSPELNMDKALGLAAALEDGEVARELELRK